MVLLAYQVVQGATYQVKWEAQHRKGLSPWVGYYTLSGTKKSQMQVSCKSVPYICLFFIYYIYI